MMSYDAFFKKSTVSNIVKAGGPSSSDQLLAMANGDYWTVLNTDLLSPCQKGTTLCRNANAFKHALQTYGPTANKLPDLRMNEGKAKNHVYHGHVHDSNSTIYILEWTIIDSNQKIMAIIGFDTHENYKFIKTPLNPKEISKIMASTNNQKILSNVQLKINEAKEKVTRVENNYVNLLKNSNYSA